MVRVHVLVSGTVQGVFFRESCRSAAERAGVAGWVRNLRDGRVEALFDGPDEAVDSMVSWCRHGPPRATVLAIEVEPYDDRVPITGFEVRPTHGTGPAHLRDRPNR
ncbi:MAG: acylphosphatase [Thermoplasmatota archaeon]